MLRFIFRRALLAVPTLLLVSVLVFSLQKLLPGDPVLSMAGEERDPQTLSFLREKYHLNDPLPVQYLRWLGDALQGDFGQSLRTGQPVSALLAQKLPVTLELSVLSMAVAVVLGIPAGIISAVRRGSALDFGANLVALSGLSLPHFWLGVVLILIFAVNLGWFPASGYVPPAENLGANLLALVLPSLVLGAGLAAALMRHTRGAMLSVLRSDYIRTAWAKGLRPRTVILKHAFRNALVPIITIATLLFGDLLGGAVLTEQVFTIPGFGKMVVDAVFTRDYAVVQGVVLCVAVGFIVLNLLADMLYVLLNPRLRGR
jgi:peptide/nickel transport system permease protein